MVVPPSLTTRTSDIGDPLDGPWLRCRLRALAHARCGALAHVFGGALPWAAQVAARQFAHVVYSEFSMTYASVRSQPKASPVPEPSPRSSAKTTSGASIAARAA